jgi:integrase
MSLYRRGDVWWSRIKRNGNVIQRSTKATNLNDARRIESVWLSELALGNVGIFKPPKLVDFETTFVQTIWHRVSKGTRRFYFDAYKVLIHEDSPLRNLKLNAIDDRSVQAFVEWVKKKPYTRSFKEDATERYVGTVMINHYLRTLRRILHVAHEQKLIGTPPRIHLLRGEPQRELTINETDLARFVALCDSEELAQEFPFKARRFHPEMRAVLPFLVDTGLRAGELCALDRTDISAAGVMVRQGKTKNARRTVPLTARAKIIVEQLPKPATTEALFTRGGHRMSVGFISHQFTAMRRKLGLPDGLCLHSCRHTFCSRLGAKGASPYVIQKLAGHASIVISARYTHSDQAQLQAAVAMLE